MAGYVQNAKATNMHDLTDKLDTLTERLEALSRTTFALRATAALIQESHQCEEYHPLALRDADDALETLDAVEMATGLLQDAIRLLCVDARVVVPEAAE